MRLATKTALITGGNSGIGLRRTSPDGHGRVHTASGGRILRDGNWAAGWAPAKAVGGGGAAITRA